MKAALDYALEAGQLLTEQKEELNHGEFLPWLKENMPFSRQTADRYVKLYQYKNKMPTVGNLQEAYRRIESIEEQEKQSETQKQKARIIQFHKTGEKPEGWKRGTDDKAAEGYKKEIKRQKEEIKNKKVEQEQKKKKHNEFWQTQKRLEEQARQAQERIAKQLENFSKHEHLNLSGYAENMNQSAMFQAIENYINSFDDVSRQLEATHNLIRKLKIIANELQVKSAGEQ